MNTFAIQMPGNDNLKQPNFKIFPGEYVIRFLLKMIGALKIEFRRESKVL